MKAEEKIKYLKDKKYKLENLDLIKEINDNLQITHQSNLEDITLYSDKISKLKEQFKKNEEILLNLRKENEILKKEKVKTQIKEENKNKINNIKDLSKSIGLQIIKETKSNNMINNNTNTDNTNIINDENKKK
jgi:ABC-type uncharacterized transport system ATPase subunit